MAPLTKRKYAKSRQLERRGHQAVVPSAMDSCSQCHNVKMAHHACPTCGYYNGREAVKIDAPKKKSA
jgi:large subunit ribosomal protein L32